WGTCGARTAGRYIPEGRGRKNTGEDRPREWRRATEANRRRVQGARSKRLQKLRSERVERSFAHVCETGGGRRTWLRGLVNVAKRYVVQVAGYNRGVLMRKLFGVGKPRALQGAAGLLVGAVVALYRVWWLWAGRGECARVGLW